MAHRAQQVLDAMVALLQANTNLAANVYKHRVKPVDADNATQPAVVVRLGADQPVDQSGETNLAFIDSLLAVSVVLIADGMDEADVIDKLMVLRTQSHISLQSDQTLALTFVSDCRYQGANAPEIKADAGLHTGALETLWLVWYRMNLADPS